MNRPTKPGFYWALWLKASPGTHNGDELTPALDWEVVEVWLNHIRDDEEEKFGVSVPGVQETQWPEDFEWGEGPLVRNGGSRG
jgi:hypothetical protein